MRRYVMSEAASDERNDNLGLLSGIKMPKFFEVLEIDSEHSFFAVNMLFSPLSTKRVLCKVLKDEMIYSFH